MHERLITDIGYPGIYSLSVKRQGFTDKHIKTTLVRKKAGFHGQAHQNHNLSVKRRGFTDKCIFLILVDSIIEIITEKG